MEDHVPRKGAVILIGDGSFLSFGSDTPEFLQSVASEYRREFRESEDAVSELRMCLR
jgi:hypothetical protein